MLRTITIIPLILIFVSPISLSWPYNSPTYLVKTTTELLSALKRAQPGNTIEISPGTYTIKQRKIHLSNGGIKGLPIRVYAKKPGSVQIHLQTLEGFYINSPYWIFENLIIKGTCTEHHQCEHAFHIVGQANYIVIKNNTIVDFNSAIKGNGLLIKHQRIHPDNVQIQNNRIYNTSARNTDHPVTPIDIVSGNHWQITGNLIADFIKLKGNRVSYAAFLKGGGTDGLFANNRVICSHHLDGSDHIQIGLSFGGGGTGKAFFQTSNTRYEHINGTIRNNLIINCPNDVGIYINSAKDTKIIDNILYNTQGIDIRYPSDSAVLENNRLNGYIHSRNGAKILKQNNQEGLSLTELQLWLNASQTQDASE